MRKKDFIKVGNTEEIIGAKTKVRVVKNKLASPFKEAELEVIYGEGVSREGENTDSGGKMAGILKKSGSWFSFGEYRLGQGRDAVRQFLKENPEVSEKMLFAALEKLNIDPKIALG